MKRIKQPRKEVMRRLGEIQDLIGRARACYMDDRSPDRAGKVLDALEKAFNLAVNTQDP